jgi:hypothetical protein
MWQNYKKNQVNHPENIDNSAEKTMVFLLILQKIIYDR